MRTFVACVVAEGFGEHVGFPPFGDSVILEVGEVADESGVVFFGLFSSADDDWSNAVWMGGVEAHFCADPFCSFAASVSAFPPDIYAKTVVSVGFEHCRSVPEGITIVVVLEDGAVVAPSVADDFGEAFTGYADEVCGAMGWIVHGGVAVPPRAFPARIAVGFVEEVVQAVVLIFGFGVVNFAEIALFVEFAGGNRVLLVVAGFGHHVCEAVFLDGVVEEVCLGDGCDAGWHRANHVFSVFHRFYGVFNVVWGFGE